MVLHSSNVRVNEVRLLSLGVLRHHSSDCLRQRPSVGGYSSQFARTLLRLCFAKLLVLLVGGPDNATACAPYGARPVASGNLTTSSQVHLVAGASRAHPTRRLWRGRISWRCGDWEFGRSFSKSPKLQVSQQRKQQRAFVCLCRRSHLVILGNKVRKFRGGTLKRVEIYVRCCVICEIAQFWGDGRRFAPKVV